MIKENTIKELTVKAQSLLVEPPKQPMPKRLPFQVYDYGPRVEEENPERRREQYRELEVWAQKEITKKINEHLFEEEMDRLKIG